MSVDITEDCKMKIVKITLGANQEIETLIDERYKKSCKENNLFAQVYYLNLLYNYCDKKSDEATQTDLMLNGLLRKIELYFEIFCSRVKL